MKTEIEDIGLEFKKINMIEALNSNDYHPQRLVEEFGFTFVKNYMQGLLSIPSSSNSAVYHLVNKAEIIMHDLKILYPVDDYPERWI